MLSLERAYNNTAERRGRWTESQKRLLKIFGNTFRSTCLNMKFMDRTLCKMLQKSVAKRNPDTYEPWMKALMCAVGQSCDWTDEKYLLPLIDYLEK